MEGKVRGGETEKPSWTETYRKFEDDDHDIDIAQYDAREIPALRNEPYSPYRGERLRVLEGAAIHAYMGDYSVNMIPKTWDSYASGAIGSMLDGNDRDEREIRRKVDQLVDRSAPDIEKMKRIVTWVNDSLRYRSFDDSYEYDPIKALEAKEGQAGEINSVVGLMLLNAGLNTDFLLIHSAYDRPVDESFVAPGLYYTPGLEVEIEDSTFYLFPYIRNYPLGHIPSYLQNQSALVMDEGGFKKFDSIPGNSLSTSIITSEYDAEIDEDGLVTVVERRTMEGEDGFGFRREIENLDEEDLEDEVEDLIVYEGGVIDFQGYEMENREEYGQPLIITLRYTIDGLVTMTPEEAIVRIEELFSPAFSYSRKVDIEERKNPIRIYTEEQVNKKVTLTVPSTWRVNDLPDEVSEKTSFGEATARYSYTPGKLTATYSPHPSTGFTPG